MRYRKSPQDVRREYVKIHTSILRPLLMADSGFCVKIYVFGMENLNLGFN